MSVQRSKQLQLVRGVDNPYCVRCRSKMRKAGIKKGRRYFRCYGCGQRALNESQRRYVTPAEHVASCARCRRALVTAGNKREYLRCITCKYLVARVGVTGIYTPQQHRASCVTCCGRMTRRSNRGRLLGFYCPRCKQSVQHAYQRSVVFSTEDLPALIETYVPKELWGPIRAEVCADILIALLKTRRAKNGYGLKVRELSPEVVRRYVKSTWRNQPGRLRHISLDEGEFPYRERLVG